MKKISKWSGLVIGMFLSFGAWQVTHSEVVSSRVAQGLLHTAWVRAQASGLQVRPWPWADTWPLARLSVPHLNVEQIVLTHAIDEDMSAFALGHSNSSVLPGELGNSVLNAHHRQTFETFLKKLKPGDTLVLESPRSGRWHYKVSAIYIVDKTDTHLVTPSLKRRLTLISNYPSPDLINGLRYVVIADEIERLA
ncbi:MAG: sortase [Thiomargarita sp.]|nr:sortase [Thiomargarita sp.]